MEVSCWVLDVDADCYCFETIRVPVGVTLDNPRGCFAPLRGVKKRPRRLRSRLMRRGEVPVSVPTEYLLPRGIVDAVLQ